MCDDFDETLKDRLDKTDKGTKTLSFDDEDWLLAVSCLALLGTSTGMNFTDTVSVVFGVVVTGKLLTVFANKTVKQTYRNKHQQ